jgi:parallel beta-helix repeat protein
VRLAPISVLVPWCAALLLTGCGVTTVMTTVADPADVGESVTKIEPGPDAVKQLQTALINAQAGDVIELGAGRFDFKATLSLDVSHVTLRGKGADQTILSFKEQGQGTGGEGVLVTSKENVAIEDLAVEDARGDAVKIQGTTRIKLRNVRAEWLGGAKETNGAYGLYPVLCTDVLIEGCTAIGASDAGIYVGQSRNIIVRRSKAQKNVAGIEIENCTNADVHDNLATDNSGGILVFTLPELPKKDGAICRVFKNRIVANNHDNFAPKGNTVATIPPGTGVMIMANDKVEVFDNMIQQNQTAGLSIVSYMITQKPYKDEAYDPFCEAIFVHNNHFSGNGAKPAGALGELLTGALGSPLPDILYDGVTDPRKLVNGALPAESMIRIRDNGGATFANFDAPALVAAASGGKPPALVRDSKAYEGSIERLPAVRIEGLP